VIGRERCGIGLLGFNASFHPSTLPILCTLERDD
jgi:hypothetical protein